MHAAALLRIFLVVFVALHVTRPGHSAQVVVFGDSWGTGARTAFVDMFDRHNAGVTVDNRAVGGTFAQMYALTPNALRNAVSANPDATHVWLSLGGNDGIARLAIGQRPIEAIVNATVGFLKMSLDPLVEMHPHIQVHSERWQHRTLLLWFIPSCALLHMGRVASMSHSVTLRREHYLHECDHRAINETPLQVLVFGYEIIDLGPGPLCAVLGAALFPECRERKP
eukprot:SAG11_NODE_1660_length_4498_cov_5.293021_2_plen_225_part_00